MEVTYSCQDQNQEGLAEFKIMGDPIPFDKDGRAYYHLFNRSPDMGEEEHLILVGKVFAFVNKQLWPLEILPTRDHEKAFFKIFFVDKDLKARDQDGKVILNSPYKFAETTLAAQYTNYGGKWSGYCLINDEFYFQLKDDEKTGAKDLVKILIHEICGHGLGLNHSLVKNDIMHGLYNPNNTWTADSINGLLSLYGSYRNCLLYTSPSPRD